MIECISIDYFNIESLFYEIKIMIRDTARKSVSGKIKTREKIKRVLKVPSGNERKMEIPCSSNTNLLHKYHYHVFTKYSVAIIFRCKKARQVMYSVVGSSVHKYRMSIDMTGIYA
jgi:hypothetical protein